MKEKNVLYFTDEEEKFANLLIEIGTRKNIAKVLVFLVNTPEASSHEIERGIDLRQPEVSMAMRFLSEKGWIRCREVSAESIGRPKKIYTLAKPITEIMNYIEEEKKEEANHQLALIRKLRDYVH